MLELARRRLSNANPISLLDFTKSNVPNYRVGSCHQDLSDALELVERGDIKRLGVAFPPQHGKTELSSIQFACLALARNPNRRIILASYSAERAEFVSGKAREVARSDEFQKLFPHLKLDTRSQAQTLWKFEGYTGYIKAVGQGGPLTGFGADILIIDDPIKDREAADSEVQRQKLWDWYTSVAYTRLAPDGAIVVIQTRWHEDDLLGRLLLMQEHEGADQWTMLHFPAVSDEGKYLWPERYKPEDYERIKITVGPRDWSALYQGRPVPPEGQTILRKWFTPIDILPAGLKWVRYWDLAYTTKTSADYTACVKLAIDPYTRAIYIADAWHGRLEWSQVRERIINQCLADGRDILCAIEKNGTQVTMVQEIQSERRLTGYAIYGSKIDADKYTRAMAWAGVAAQSGVWMQRHIGCYDELIQECITFPLAAHDDLVDAISGAFRTHLDCFAQEQNTSTNTPLPYSPEWIEALRRDQEGPRKRRHG